MVGVHPDVMLVFGCSYLKWNEPGGFMEYSNGHIPADTYDNTQRGWFGAAVNAPEQKCSRHPGPAQTLQFHHAKARSSQSCYSTSLKSQVILDFCP